MKLMNWICIKIDILTIKNMLYFGRFFNSYLGTVFAVLNKKIEYFLDNESFSH